jgi:hypothetical protein
MEEARVEDGFELIADLAMVAKEAAEGTVDREALRNLARQALDKHAPVLAATAQLAREMHAAEFPKSMAPNYWMNETTGVLRPVIEKYLRGDALDGAECATMRAYCRQWIMADGFVGEDVMALRREVHTLTNNAAVRTWMEKAFEANVDPL